MTTTDTFEIKTGDRRPLFVVNLKADFDEPGEATIDLSAASSAVFNMRNHRTGTAVIVRGAATISNVALGEVTYNWGTADTATAGIYDAEIEVTWNDGKAETFPGGPAGGNYWRVLVTSGLG